MKKCLHVGKWVLSLLLLWVAVCLATPVDANARVIKLGIIGPMTFSQGEHIWKGADLALDEIKAAGGINVGGTKMQVELIKIDTNEIMSLSNATSAVEKAITRDKVDFLIGGYSSGAILAMQEITSDYKKIFLLAASGSHPEITARVAKDYDRYKYFFRAGTYSAVNVAKVSINALPHMADKIRKELGVKQVKVAMLMEQTKWVEPQIPLYQQEIPKLGLEVTGVWRVSISALDVSAQLMAIKESGAHIILSMCSGPVAIPLYRQLAELEIPVLLTGVNTEAEGGKFYQATNGLCAYGSYLTQQADVEITPRTKPFYKKFREKFKEEPNMTAGAYNSLLVLKEAIERAGSLDSDKVVVALEKTDFQGTSGRQVFNKEHDSIFGPGYLYFVNVQIMPGNVLNVTFPLNYGGAKEIQIPPWMAKYWKEKAVK